MKGTIQFIRELFTGPVWEPTESTPDTREKTRRILRKFANRRGDRWAQVRFDLISWELMEVHIKALEHSRLMETQIEAIEDAQSLSDTNTPKDSQDATRATLDSKEAIRAMIVELNTEGTIGKQRK